MLEVWDGHEGPFRSLQGEVMIAILYYIILYYIILYYIILYYIVLYYIILLFEGGYGFRLLGCGDRCCDSALKPL